MKKVFVALADKKFIEHSKSLIYSAKVDGKWEGDFVLIVPESDKGEFDEKEFTDKGVEIFFGKTLPGNPIIINIIYGQTILNNGIGFFIVIWMCYFLIK